MPDEPVDVVRLRTASQQNAQAGVGEHAFTLRERPAPQVHGLRPEDQAVIAYLEALKAQSNRLEAKLDALETLVREIRHALSAGAVGKWGNP